ncbi:hypothetical protein ACLOJK_006597 [Asimina triloba]
MTLNTLAIVELPLLMISTLWTPLHFCHRCHAVEDGGLPSRSPIMAGVAGRGPRRCCPIDLETPLRSVMDESMQVACPARWVDVEDEASAREDTCH